MAAIYRSRSRRSHDHSACKPLRSSFKDARQTSWLHLAPRTTPDAGPCCISLSLRLLVRPIPSPLLLLFVSVFHRGAVFLSLTARYLQACRQNFVPPVFSVTRSPRPPVSIVRLSPPPFCLPLFFSLLFVLIDFDIITLRLSSTKDYLGALPLCVTADR